MCLPYTVVHHKLILALSFQVAKRFPTFAHLFRPSPGSLLTVRNLIYLLKPDFDEDGSNRRQFEGEVYKKFVKYLRETGSKLIS